MTPQTLIAVTIAGWWNMASDDRFFDLANDENLHFTPFHTGAFFEPADDGDGIAILKAGG